MSGELPPSYEVVSQAKFRFIKRTSAPYQPHLDRYAGTPQLLDDSTTNLGRKEDLPAYSTPETHLMSSSSFGLSRSKFCAFNRLDVKQGTAIPAF